LDTSPSTEDAKEHRRESQAKQRGQMRNRILRCLVKTHNSLKTPFRGKTMDIAGKKKLRPERPDAPDGRDAQDTTSLTQTQLTTAPCFPT